MPIVDLTFNPGTYYAGIDRPWYASQGAVRGKLEEMGLTNVRFYPRDTPPPVQGAGFNPLVDPHYTDEWDEWIVADYSGPSRTLKNVDKVWAWMSYIPAGAEYDPKLATNYGALAKPLASQLLDRLPSVPTLSDKQKQMGGAMMLGIAIELSVMYALVRYARKRKGRKAAA